jgi:hypothetical protein
VSSARNHGALWPQDFFRDYFIDSDQVFKLKVGHPLPLWFKGKHPLVRRRTWQHMRFPCHL